MDNGDAAGLNSVTSGSSSPQVFVVSDDEGEEYESGPSDVRLMDEDDLQPDLVDPSAHFPFPGSPNNPSETWLETFSRLAPCVFECTYTLLLDLKKLITNTRVLSRPGCP
jgi:hypothetical protein